MKNEGEQLPSGQRPRSIYEPKTMIMKKEPFDLAYWLSFSTNESLPPAELPEVPSWQREEPEDAEPPMPTFPFASGQGNGQNGQYWQNCQFQKSEDFPVLL